MPLWRCPHCATPQAETARCWVCHRSSTACGACRHFRRSVAAQLGYCGLDRQRGPLTGDEIRPCWEAADATGATIPALPGIGPVWPLTSEDGRTAVRPLQFVEVPPGTVPAVAADAKEGSGPSTTEPVADSAFVPTGSGTEPRWSLWGEPEA
jgi:hypothetical protein